MCDVYEEVESMIGSEAAMLLAERFGGQNIYFPTLSSYERHRRDRAIRKEFNGDNLRELVRRYCLSEQRIRDILKGGSDA